MIKKCYVLAVVLIVVALNAFAIDYPQPTSWVNDYAGVLSRDQQQELDSMLRDFETTTTNQIFVCVMKSLPANTSLENYVNELFERWQPGQAGKDNGALLAIFISDRKLRIEVGYGLEEKLTDADSKLIIANEIASGFKQGDYYQGIKNGIGKMMLTIKDDYKPQATKLIEKPSSEASPKTRSTYQSRSSARTKTTPSPGPGIVLFIGFIGVSLVIIQILRGALGNSENYSYSSSSGWSKSSRWKGRSKLFTKSISPGKPRSSGGDQSSKRQKKRSSSSFSISFGRSNSESSSFGRSSTESSSSFSFGKSSSGSHHRRSSSSKFSGGGGGLSGGGGASGSW